MTAIVAFAPGFDAPFVFDDTSTIVSNPYLRQLFPPSAPPQSAVAGRPVISLSLALNAAVGDLNPVVYRAGNLAIHVIAGMLLFGVLRRTLTRPAIPPAIRSAAGALSLVTALLWLIHPLQTEVVDYVTQRTESMMGLFYFLTLHAAIRFIESGRIGWASVAIVACALGMGCKESMVTAPIMVVLWDVVFETRSLRRSLRHRAWFYVGLAASWMVLAVLIAPGPRWRSAGFQSGASPWVYLLHQSEMILTYLRLSVWPYPLVLDYGPTTSITLRDVFPAAAVVVSLLIGSVLTWRKSPPVAYAATWFWMTLAPTSSVIPIETEVGAERRMYLPLAALLTLVVIGGYGGPRRLIPASTPRRRVAVGGVVALGGVLTALDLRRHRDYQSELTIWQTVLERRPHDRARYNVGVVLAEAGRTDEAITYHRQATAGYPRAHYALGVELERRGEYDAAIREYETFVQRMPDDVQAPEGYARLGIVLAQQERWLEAIAALEQAIRMRPNMADAWGALADSLVSVERYADAERAYRELLRLTPDDPIGHRNFALTMLAQRRAPEAIPLFERAIQLDPNDAVTYQHLGNALLAVGRLAPAVERFRQAEQLEPTNPRHPVALAVTLVNLRRVPEAIEVLERALQRMPTEVDLRVAYESLRREHARQ